METTQTHTPAWRRACTWLAAVAFLGSLAATPSARANDHELSDLPGLEVPAGNVLHFHGFGRGFQVYTWDGASWTGPVPDATLFDGEGVVASHFAGPSWESNSGSLVVGALFRPPVTVDHTAIPWLVLRAVSAEGPGIFANTTFIQRLNTTGGRAPSTPGSFVGQLARIPYTADYFFYEKGGKQP